MISGVQSASHKGKQNCACLPVMVLVRESAGEVWYYFDQIINYPVTLINATDASTINWSNYDVVILPDGNYRFLNDKNATEQFKSWINHGGHVIAMESAVAKLAQLDWGLKSKKEDTSDIQ